MNQIPIKTTCNACQGEGLLSTGKIYTLGGMQHPVLNKCVACEGRGTLLSWVDMRDLIQMLHAIEAEKDAE